MAGTQERKRQQERQGLEQPRNEAKSFAAYTPEISMKSALHEYVSF